MTTVVLLCAFLLNVACADILPNVDPKPDDNDNSEMPETQPKPEDGSGEINGYKLVWEDQFEGDKLNTAFWTIEVNGDGGGNNELQYYRSENITVGKEPESQVSCLIITGKKESYKGKSCTSGRLITKDKVTFKYGKLEARIKLPKTANGIWPAFWAMGNDITSVGWPKCGETDIMEMGNTHGINTGTQERYFNGAFHWGERWDSHRYIAMDFTSEYSLQDDFHLYTLEWTPDSINMYLDKDIYPDTKPYFKLSIADKSNGQPGYYAHKPNFVLLNMAIGGNFTGIWDINKITALNNGDVKMYVDFVKIYQRDEDEGKELKYPAL